MGYIKELRKLVGSRPVIMAGACVLVIDHKQRVLLREAEKILIDDAAIYVSNGVCTY